MITEINETSFNFRFTDGFPFWQKWAFILIIVGIISGCIYYFAFISKPIIWGMVVIGLIILIYFMKELPNNYDREYIFSKDKSIFKKIEHPWVGKPRVYQYPLSDILDINIKAQIINRHHYAELDYDYENRPVVEPQYDIEVVLKSKETVEIYLNNSRIFAEQLRSRILLLLNVKE